MGEKKREEDVVFFSIHKPRCSYMKRPPSHGVNIITHTHAHARTLGQARARGRALTHSFAFTHERERERRRRGGGGEGTSTNLVTWTPTGEAAPIRAARGPSVYVYTHPSSARGGATPNTLTLFNPRSWSLRGRHRTAVTKGGGGGVGGWRRSSCRCI